MPVEMTPELEQKMREAARLDAERHQPIVLVIGDNREYGENETYVLRGPVRIVEFDFGGIENEIYSDDELYRMLKEATDLAAEIKYDKDKDTTQALAWLVMIIESIRNNLGLDDEDDEHDIIPPQEADVPVEAYER